jgi:ketosteroid isomerase-like protein
MCADEHAAIARRCYDAVNRRALDTLDRLSDVELELTVVPFDYRIRGITGVMSALHACLARIPDLTVSLVNQVADTSQVVNEFVVRGSLKAADTTTTPLPQTLGGPFALPAIQVWRFRSGRVVSVTTYFDATRFQHGAAPYSGT